MIAGVGLLGIANWLGASYPKHFICLQYQPLQQQMQGSNSSGKCSRKTLRQLSEDSTADTPWFCSCVCWEEDVVPEFGRENLLRVYEFIKCPAWIAMKLQIRRGTVRHSQSMSELWISRVKGTASMRRKFLSFLSFRTKVEDLIAQAGIKAPVLPGHRPRVFPWFEGKAMVSWKHMAHEAINIYTSAWMIILMDLGRHNKVGSARNRQCRVGWKGCGRASLCRALSEARFGWIRVQKLRSGRCVLARYRASWQTFWRWI